MNSAQFSQRVQTQEQKEGELCSIKIENNSDEQKEEELSQKLIDHHPKEEKRKNSAQNSETNKNPRSSIDPKIRTLPYRLTSSRAKLWAKLNHAPILPEHINCEGCRVDGVKTVYCESLCGIRQCALKKGMTTCGDCPGIETCQDMGEIISNHADALKNLKG